MEGYQTVRTTVLIRSKTTSSKTMTFRPASRVTVEGGGRIRWADSEGNESSVSLPFELFRPNLDGLRLKGEGRSSGVAPRDGVVVAIREGTEMAVRWGRPGIDALGASTRYPKHSR